MATGDMGSAHRTGLGFNGKGMFFKLPSRDKGGPADPEFTNQSNQDRRKRFSDMSKSFFRASPASGRANNRGGFTGGGGQRSFFS